MDIHVNSPLVPPVADCDLTLLGAREDFDANIIARPIASSAGILCASHDYLERYSPPQQPEALAQHRCLRLKQPSNRHCSWQLIKPEDGKRKVDIAVKPAMLANHSKALKPVLSPWITARPTLYGALPSRNSIPQRTSVLQEFMMDYTRRMIRQMEKKSR